MMIGLDQNGALRLLSCQWSLSQQNTTAAATVAISSHTHHCRDSMGVVYGVLVVGVQQFLLL